MDYQDMVEATELPDSLQERLVQSLEDREPDEEEAREAIQRVVDLYEDSQYQPAEAVGVIAAQSISEPATQMTMRTYHFMGAAGRDVTQGLPKMIEIVDARRNPSTPAMDIYLKEEYNNKEFAKKLASRIKETTLKNVAKEDTLDLVDSRLLVELQDGTMERLGMDEEEMIKASKKGTRKFEAEMDGNTVIFTPKKDMDIRDLQKNKIKLLNSPISGIKDVDQVVVQKDNGDWVIRTVGSNLKKVLKMEGVDPTRTICNDIREMEKVFGIEACRNSIIKEAQDTLDQQGLDVDVRHLLVLADMMTVDGEVKAVGRYGVAGDKGSVLARANFEVTVRNLMNAAAEGEVDELDSIINNVIVNQPAPVGTGMCDLVYKGEREIEA